MLRKSVLLFIIVAALLVSASSVLALVPPVEVYVDYAWAGTESGTKEAPYNTMNEAVYYAQNQPGGGVIYVKQADGSWKAERLVQYVRPGPTGIPLARPVLFGILVGCSLLLILAGLMLKRRSRSSAR